MIIGKLYKVNNAWMHCNSYIRFFSSEGNQYITNEELDQIIKNKCFYKILNVDTKIEKKDLKKHYQVLVKKYHPDIVASSNTDKEKATKAFTKINDAYKILKDSIKREKYDKAREFVEKNMKQQQGHDKSKNYDDFVKDTYDFRSKYEESGPRQYDYWGRKNYTEGHSEFHNQKRHTQEEKYKARNQDRKVRHESATNGGWVVQLVVAGVLIPNPISDWLFGCSELSMEQELARRTRDRMVGQKSIGFGYPVNPVAAQNALNLAVEEKEYKNFKIIQLDKSNDPFLVPRKKKKDSQKFIGDLNSSRKLKKEKIKIGKSAREIASRNKEMNLQEYYNLQLDTQRKLGV